MTMTFSLGWWAIPLALTIMSLFMVHKNWPEPAGGYAGAGNALLALLMLLAATAFSLLCWLVWALLI